MIRQAARPSNAWTPRGFAEHELHYPETRWQPTSPGPDLSDEFIAEWDKDDSSSLDPGIAVVLTPGLFAEWLPGCFRKARDTFSDDGHRTLRSQVRTGTGVFAQAGRLANEVSAWLADDEQFIWCGHSKGGLELLRALETDAQLLDRCIAAVVVQPPVGPSHVLQHLKSADASASQRIANRLMQMKTFVEGVGDVSFDRSTELTHWLEQFTPSVPTVCVASWSIEPTSWIDSWHRILERACPGIAHDGQFLTHDQVLPEAALIALPHIDHAQPVLGGNGFDPGRFWKTLARFANSTAVRQTFAVSGQTR